MNEKRKISRLASFAGLALSLLLLVAPDASADTAIAMNFSSASTGNTGTDHTAGFAFTMDAPITVASLDSYLTGGFTSGVVEIYDGSGDVLASATVLATDPTEIIGGFTYYVHAITPVTLSANTTYFAAADVPAEPANFPVIFDAVGLQSAAHITFDFAVLQAGYTTPTTAFSGLGAGIFTANFDVVVVPEPSSLALFGFVCAVAAVAMALRGSRRSDNRENTVAIA